MEGVSWKYATGANWSCSRALRAYLPFAACTACDDAMMTTDDISLIAAVDCGFNFVVVIASRNSLPFEKKIR